MTGDDEVPYYDTRPAPWHEYEPPTWWVVVGSALAMALVIGLGWACLALVAWVQ